MFVPKRKLILFDRLQLLVAMLALLVTLDAFLAVLHPHQMLLEWRDTRIALCWPPLGILLAHKWTLHAPWILAEAKSPCTSTHLACSHPVNDSCGWCPVRLVHLDTVRWVSIGNSTQCDKG